MSYGQSNPWDHSSILLSNNAGANIGRGIERAGKKLSDGFSQYFENKKKLGAISGQNEGLIGSIAKSGNSKVLERIDQKLVEKVQKGKATLDDQYRLNGMLNAALSQDKDEREQLREKEQQRMQAEMQASQMTHLAALTDQMQAMMQDRAAESRAMQAAGAPAAGITNQIDNGAAFKDLDPKMAPDRLGIYMRAGGKNPSMIQAMMKERPFTPSAVDLPGGGRMLMTSPNSAVPDPAMREKAKSEPGAAGGPEYSKDKKFYRSGPSDKWKPIKVTAAASNPIAKAELNSLPGEIAALEKKISDAAGEPRQGNKKPGPDWMPGLNTYDEKIQGWQADLVAKRKRLQSLGSEADDDGELAPISAAGGRKPVGDPFSYVLGN